MSEYTLRVCGVSDREGCLDTLAIGEQPSEQFLTTYFGKCGKVYKVSGYELANDTGTGR